VVFWFTCNPAFSQQNKFNVRETVLYTGFIRCLEMDGDTAFNEMISAAVNDCGKYDMTTLILEPSITPFPCEGNVNLISIYFVYKCYNKKDK
jgi:hypothetical protein